MPARRFAEFLARMRGTAKDKDAARFAAILGLNRAIAGTHDRREVLQLLLDEAVELFAAERGFLIEAGDGDAFRIALARSLDREPVKSPEKKISSTIVRRCIQSREGVYVEDAQDTALGAAQSVADLQLRSVLCIPLVAGDRCHGVLYLDHRFHTHAFKAEDLPWAQALADQGAIALRMFEAVAAEAERAASIARDNERLVETLEARESELAASLGCATRASLQHEYQELVGDSPALLRCLAMLDRVAAVDLAVLLAGESGSGKELAARAIHRNSHRRDGPFVPVDVAAISPAVLESELFGHEKGAFTGADTARLGLIRAADKGVLFLDEVTEMPLEMQVKLLRVLEDHRVRPVGSDKTHAIDLRIVAATNREPQRAVDEAVLRADLFYRLSAMTVRVPPLRERLADIPALVDAFLATAARERNGPKRRADPKLLDTLRRRSWPGNLRQLRNEVMRLDALATSDVIGAELLEKQHGNAVRTTLDLRELEQWAIAEALRVTEGNKAAAARLLGISRRALYNKLGR